MPECTPAQYALVSLEGDDVVDLPGQFFGMSDSGERLAARKNDFIPFPRYTSTGDNDGGLDNHFQGLQRLRVPGWAALSGGDPHTPMSHLFLLRLGSRGAAAMWGSNLLHGELPPPEDRCEGRLDLNATLWHAGGMSLLGDILAVPLENADTGASRIEFFDVRDPAAPTDLRSGVSRPAVKAGAVGLARREDGRFLLAVWSDSEKQPPRRHFDLYQTREATLLRATWDGPFCFTEGFDAFPSFQTIDLLWNVDDTGTRTDLYLVGFENQAAAAPSPRGPHRGVLYHVTLPAPLGGPGAGLELVEVGEKTFRCLANFADMDAAVGVYQTGERALGVYCGHHFIHRGPGNQWLFRFQEYFASGPGDETAVIASLGQSRIELFSRPSLRGSPLVLLSGQASIEDLDAVRVRGRAMPERAASVRCRLPRGFALVLYREPGRAGPRPLVIAGTGGPVAIDDLGDLGFADAARSCAVVALRVAKRLRGASWVGG